MSRLSTFAAPRPNMAMLSSMAWVNRIFMLRGLPILRDIPGLNRLPPFRGLANVRHIDLPAADEQRLAALVGRGKAVFFAPNHPEFFTDWMIDKEILWRVAPWAASWATSTVVNGLGAVAQKFWLANNLIAQIPGNSEPAKQHSVGWAGEGHGVLLHPEGGVGWHSDFVAPLMSGAFEMGLEALERGRRNDPRFEVWIAPIVWKLHFLHDVEAALKRECDYVERRLKLAVQKNELLPGRVLSIYSALLSLDEEKLGMKAHMGASYPVRLRAVVKEVSRRLRSIVSSVDSGRSDAGKGNLQRHARRWLRENKANDPAKAKTVKSLTDQLARLMRVGDFAFDERDITQEQIAEHIKRIRTDYCKGTLRDTLGAMVPQSATARRAVIRVPEPIGLHSVEGSPEAVLALLRSRMQAALDEINAELRAQGAFRTYPKSLL